MVEEKRIGLRLHREGLACSMKILTTARTLYSPPGWNCGHFSSNMTDAKLGIWSILPGLDNGTKVSSLASAPLRCMYIYVVSTFSEVWINRVGLPILLVVR